MNEWSCGSNADGSLFLSDMEEQKEKKMGDGDREREKKKSQTMYGAFS